MFDSLQSFAWTVLSVIGAINLLIPPFKKVFRNLCRAYVACALEARAAKKEITSSG